MGIVYTLLISGIVSWTLLAHEIRSLLGWAELCRFLFCWGLLGPRRRLLGATSRSVLPSGVYCLLCLVRAPGAFLGLRRLPCSIYTATAASSLCILLRQSD